MPPPPNTPVEDIPEGSAPDAEVERIYRQIFNITGELMPPEPQPQPPRSPRASSPSSRTPVSRASTPSATRSRRNSSQSQAISVSPLQLSPDMQASTPTRHQSPAPIPRPEVRPPHVPLDYQDLHYIDDVDDTLMCPICRTPFHEPITTKRCGHTFCTECLRQAIELQPCCPIDRRPIAFHPDQLCNPRIVGHQLDRLKVRCPNAGCDVVTTRGSIKTHYDRDRPQTHVLCPDPECTKGVARCDFDTCIHGGPLCLHEKLNCRYCTKKIVFTDREKHYATECEGHTTTCADCSAVVVRHRMQKHLATQCLEAQTVCKFMSHGCSVAGKRAVVEAHEQGGCVYEAIGKLIKDRAEDRTIINNLRSRLTAMETFRASNSNRNHSRSPHGPSTSIPDLDLSVGTRTTPQAFLPNEIGGGAALEESPEDYMLAQFERMETKMEDLRKSVTELDGRHSMMLLNETMPLKDAITELRSNLGVISMHTTWLMNVQRQNRMAAGGGGGGASGQGQRTGAGGGSGAAGTGMGTGSGSGVGSVRGDGDDGRDGERRMNVAPRRMSGENPPRL